MTLKGHFRTQHIVRKASPFRSLLVPASADYPKHYFHESD